ncbi:hypothetical protein GQR58_024219 [Nymphon striatum]|nr:hypothetical protein GQR58_024219 [Nymphon striatum]
MVLRWILVISQRLPHLTAHKRKDRKGALVERIMTNVIFITASNALKFTSDLKYETLWQKGSMLMEVAKPSPFCDDTIWSLPSLTIWLFPPTRTMGPYLHNHYQKSVQFTILKMALQKWSRAPMTQLVISNGGPHANTNATQIFFESLKFFSEEHYINIQNLELFAPSQEIKYMEVLYNMKLKCSSFGRYPHCVDRSTASQQQFNDRIPFPTSNYDTCR